MDERDAYLVLALSSGIGHQRMQHLLAAFGSASAALAASFLALANVRGMTRAAALAVREAARRDVGPLHEQLDQLSASALLPADPGFPESLREIPDPPTVLFVQGRIDLLCSDAVAIVGSRDHSAYGSRVCRLVAEAAARAGLTVVSGMARGLDALAHETALQFGGATAGVLGNGLGVIYPAANRALYERVAAEGVLVTEFPPGERPSRGSFPRRNRLVSGLARVTVVVEAAQGSGALITAGAALDQGRDVMAVPGPITERTSHGVNALIRDGAEPLLEAADLLRHFPGAGQLERPAEPPPIPAELSGMPRTVAELLADGGSELDILARRLTLPVEELLPLLSALEIEGVVRRVGGTTFALAAVGR